MRFLLIPFLTFSLSASDQLHQKLLNALNKTPQELEQNRFMHYTKKLNSLRGKSEVHKVREINHYFNSFFQEYDAYTWNAEEHWATPKEFLRRGGGDCEDFVIIKYFALLKLGIRPEQLYMTVVNVKGTTQQHMVLNYIKKGTQVPYVLDNLSFRILPMHKRTDLEPLYAFNTKNFHILKQSKRAQYDKRALGSTLNDLLIRVKRDRF
jgi:predicted transglutaminase-like cysteine proteinase